MSSPNKLVIRERFCTICRRPIQEIVVFDHYRKHHSEYMRKAQKLGRKLAKTEYGRKRRRRQIREMLRVG